MICLRFTKYEENNKHNSTDQVNHKQLAGLCCFDITQTIKKLLNEDYTEKEAYQICARLEAEHDNWHATNHNGRFIIFEGDFVEYDRDNQDRFGNRAIVANLDQVLAIGEIQPGELGWKWKNIKII